jgi:predicted nucleic acid-binding protein
MAESVPKYVLDSFAVMAHFQAESGGELVLDLLEKADMGMISLAMSLINVGEVVYLASRQRGQELAKALVDDLRALPISFYEATEERIFAAAFLKAEYPISYADAFAASLAQELKASLVTGDPEFKKLKSSVELLWLGEK